MKSVLFVMALVITQAAVAANDYIVQLSAGTNPVSFSLKQNVKLQPIVPSLRLYRATPATKAMANAAAALPHLRNQGQVLLAQKNHPVKPRTAPILALPNDKSFGKQWGLTRSESIYGIDAVSAWTVYGTSGVDRRGNEIVIAVVDGGMDVRHPDLINNAWINRAEIPGNNLDDDSNGYVDDVYGWDVEEETGTIQVDYHGTHVAGIMGAQGNNNLFGSGVNQNIRIMYVSMGWSLADTAKTMEAYGYILKQKQLWIESGGKLGANVVAINSSFGIDEGDCNSEEYAVWNTMFNQLGEVGILSAGATANQDWDIDVVGDVPTACNSDFVVSVTNSEMNGEKTEYAGHGKTTVDIAAPGTTIYSTYPSEGFEESSGTSMATPHVTGAIGYLYTVASETFITNASLDPKAAALEVKNILLRTVTPRPSMKDITVSGGILNLLTASQEIANYGVLFTPAAPAPTPAQNTNEVPTLPAQEVPTLVPEVVPTVPAVEVPTVAATQTVVGQ